MDCNFGGNEKIPGVEGDGRKKTINLQSFVIFHSGNNIRRF